MSGSQVSSEGGQSKEGQSANVGKPQESSGTPSPNHAPPISETTWERFDEGDGKHIELRFESDTKSCDNY